MVPAVTITVATALAHREAAAQFEEVIARAPESQVINYVSLSEVYSIILSDLTSIYMQVKTKVTKTKEMCKLHI